jgi:hypothetical protein
MYYGCVQWTVTATDGQYTQTQDVMVSYGTPTAGPCKGIPNSSPLIFNPTAGHGPLTLTVTNPQIDNCRLSYGNFDVANSILSRATYTSMTQWIAPGNGSAYGGCAMEIAYDNYIVSGNISIQTNTP